MADKEQKDFAYYINKLKEHIAWLELNNSVMEEIIKVQHEIIVSLSEGEEKEIMKRAGELWLK